MRGCQGRQLIVYCIDTEAQEGSEMKLFKYSHFRNLRAVEYYNVPAHIMWVEMLVNHCYDTKKVLSQGLRMDLGDIVWLLIFPVRLLLTALFGTFIHLYLRKKFYERFGSEAGTVVIPHVTFYTLDWKRWFSSAPVAGDEY